MTEMKLTEGIVKIVREASRLMLTDHFEIESKSGVENIVTSSDIAVQSFLVKELCAYIPGSSVLAEEEGMQESGDVEYLWIIDPIDGTMNYSRGIKESAISVGLMHSGEMLAGVVYSPAGDELFYAEKGKGAYFNGGRIHVSDRPFKASLICTAMSTYNKDWAPECAAVINDVYYKINDFRRFGTASLEICYLAMGRVELYFEYRLQPWDIAAGSIILSEAGGVLRGLHGAPLTFRRQELTIGANSEENFALLSEIVSHHIPAVRY